MSQGIHHTEVDGIPTLFAYATGPMRAGLVFRVGVADETLAGAGITHLVEHLALHRQGLADYHFNGATKAAFTHFHVEGAEHEIVAYLDGVCTSSSICPWSGWRPRRRSCAPRRPAGSPDNCRCGATGPRGTGWSAIRSGAYGGCGRTTYGNGPGPGSPGTTPCCGSRGAAAGRARSNCPPVGGARCPPSPQPSPPPPPTSPTARAASCSTPSSPTPPPPGSTRVSWNAHSPAPAPGGRLLLHGGQRLHLPPGRFRDRHRLRGRAARQAGRGPRRVRRRARGPPGRPDRAGRPGGRTRTQRRHADRARRGRTAAAGRGGGTASPPSAARARRTARRAVGDDTAACARGGTGGCRDGVAAGSSGHRADWAGYTAAPTTSSYAVTGTRFEAVRKDGPAMVVGGEGSV